MKLLIISVLVFLAVSPLAQADHNGRYHNSGKHSRGEFKAKVINSTPVYKYVTHRQPQTVCEPAVLSKTYLQSHDERAVILGGIVGGVIGHATSNNKHKGFGTFVGAVIGSSLAHNLDHANKKHSRTYNVNQQNCVSTYKNARKVRVLDGYNVTYRSQGKIYRTFRQDKPAKFIRIYY
jgi:uncharacterized protein YcfJ